MERYRVIYAWKPAGLLYSVLLSRKNKVHDSVHQVEIIGPMPTNSPDPYQSQLDDIYALWDDHLHLAYLNWEGRPLDPELLADVLGYSRRLVDKLERLQRTMRLQEEAGEDGEF